ncbi:hypothetical protein FHG87_007586 [Trinorchestia longiramus]|nr:hypothetical protein FHG87_007586 [Trinorchestia longiramus]
MGSLAELGRVPISTIDSAVTLTVAVPLRRRVPKLSQELAEQIFFLRFNVPLKASNNEVDSSHRLPGGGTGLCVAADNRQSAGLQRLRSWCLQLCQKRRPRSS